MSMSRRRKGAKTEPYAIRWHSYSDITTPSADIMSSPDPLGDMTDVFVMPSSVSRAPRSVTRSILSDRLVSRESSPRKQTFELEVGDNAAPQRLLVTVETEGALADTGANGTRRKLFQSPSPMPTIRQRERATTTTVPLRDTVEGADPNATPRKRGRPRKSNGTPIPGAGTKRRATTPIKRTPRRPRTTANDVRDEEPTPQPTPGSKRRGRPPKNRNLEPSDELNTDPSRGIPSATKRRRRPALSPEKDVKGAHEEPELPLNFDAESQGENEVTLVTLPSETIASEGPAPAPAEPASEGESDIWMATIDDGPTPRARTATQSGLAPSSPGLGADSSQAGDFGFFPTAASDVSSADEQLSDFGPTGGDTIAQGEDFSMIFMDSLPTLRSSVQAPVEADFGEETSLIINNTLESLRESLRKSQRRDEQGDGAETTGPSEETPRPSAKFIFFDSEPAEPEPNNPEQIEPAHTLSEHIEQEHIEPLDKDQSEHTEPPREIEPERAAPEEEPQHDELEVAEPELARFEASEPEYIEPRQIVPDDIESEHPETAPTEAEHIEPGHTGIEPIANEHSEIEQLDPYQPEPEDMEVDMDHTVFDYARSDSSESDLIAPEPTQLQEIEIEFGHAEQEHVELERTEPEDFEAERIQPEQAQLEISLPNIEEQEPIEPRLASSPSFKTRPLNAGPARPTEPESQPIIRPPFPLSPSRHLSPRWLRSPRRGTSSPLRHQLLKFKARQTDDTPPRAAGEGSSQPAFSSPGQQQSPSGLNEGDSNMYDDSFSEIPQDVLEAATPHKPRMVARQEMVSAPELEEDEEMEDTQPSQQTEEQDAPVEDAETSALTQTEAGRLPTPDDTPPQIEVEDDEQVKSTQESQASLGAASQKSSSPLVHHERQSLMVPEIVEEMVEDDDHEIPEIVNPQEESLSLDNLARPEVTPVNQMTSPLQDPQSLAPEMLQEKISRPLLSPIVRAGRALQSVTSDPPSPEPREHQLRSPFRSSVTRELGPPGLEPQSGVRLSVSPRRALAFSMANQPQPANPVYEDPFGSDPRHTGQLSFMEALERSSGKPAPHTTNESLVDSPASSMRISPPRDVEMSWVAEEGPISPNLRGDVPLKELAQHTNIEKPKSVASHATSDGDDVDMDAESVSQAQDDETDIWEFEAKRATPRTTRQQPFGNRRRGQPSPWTKQVAEKPQQNEPTERQRQDEEELHSDQESVSDADRTEEALPEEDQVEEFSLLPQKELGKNGDKDQAPKSATKASRFDLSSFFSSPALIPGMIADKLLPAKTRSVFGARRTEPEPEMVEAAPVLPTSSMFPQVAHKELQPRSGARKDLSSPIRAKQQVPREEEYSSSPEDVEEEEPDLPSIAQKKNFTPRPSQPNSSFFKSSTRSGVPTPPRMQLSHADIQRWQQETSAASDDSPEVRRPILRPLPPKNASPIKSSLRSPLKPHTPGRVVEFTSNVLSPVEQAKVRQMRRLSNSSAASQASLVAQRPPPQMTDKENHRASGASASVSDSSPGDKAPPPEPLSRTVWTRQHWLFMDELLQLRRAGPYELDYERRTEKFLGKTVKSHGEAMKLERWHLDCVDAFKAEVGGWDEAILVKRLFALIMGEERRSRGINDSPARVMFH